MNRTHINSRAAYATIVDGLPAKRRQVFQILKNGRRLTREEISNIWERPINCVTGRVHELISTGLVRECDTVMVQKKPHALLEVVPEGEYVPPEPKPAPTELEAEATRYREALEAIAAMPGRMSAQTEWLKRIANEALSGQ